MTDESGQGSVASDPIGRRYLTLVFSDLSNSTQLAEDMEAEDYAEMLRLLHDKYQATVAEHRGTVVRIQGDGMLAIFGHPSAQEDDGRRGVEAVLDLRDAVQTLTVSTKKGLRSVPGVHTGIHSGLVLVNGGDLVRGRFELHGHAPSVAAKLPRRFWSVKQLSAWKATFIKYESPRVSRRPVGLRQTATTA